MRDMMTSAQVLQNLREQRQVHPQFVREFSSAMNTLRSISKDECKKISPLDIEVDGKVAVVLNLSRAFLVCRVSDKCVEAVNLRMAA